MIKLIFETLTPLHISSGNQLAYNLEYIVNDNRVAKLNLIKASKKLAETRALDFNRNYKFFEIIRIIEENKNIFSNDDFEYSIYAESSFISYLRGERRDGRKIIQEFINSNGNFYIPGSSIKGMLSTILHRDTKVNPLGINPNNARIEDKFVITDSNFIDSDNFIVDIANRPPAINLITLDPGIEFSSEIRKLGNLSVIDLRNKLSTYSYTQMKKAEKFVTKFKDMERTPKGATAYYTALEKMLNELEPDDNEYIVNLGFGGGSYYKIFSDTEIPKFKSKKHRNTKEEAHTTFTINIENELFQLGWCKLKIEEE